jgi:hypothetical protein
MVQVFGYRHQPVKGLYRTYACRTSLYILLISIRSYLPDDQHDFCPASVLDRHLSAEVSASATIMVSEALRDGLF